MDHQATELYSNARKQIMERTGRTIVKIEVPEAIYINSCPKKGMKSVMGCVCNKCEYFLGVLELTEEFRKVSTEDWPKYHHIVCMGPMTRTTSAMPLKE
jgi:hypothetical protein